MIAWHGENCSKNPNKRNKRIWVNDGVKSLLVEASKIPEGFSLGQIRPRGKCKHCGIESSQTNISRYHNNNCKFKL
jgi:hypothetical protein